ncbi:MAG TPA: DUF5668 domain-containing protein [Terracidiphilus sp.]|nr:DUF5668 domain-containing protein [Terracidiphilus sp.]
MSGLGMNRYILIRRLRGPAILLLLGVLALLDEAGVIDHFWGLFWPLLLIMIGVLLLAERAALAMDGYGDGYGPYPCAPCGSGVDQSPAQPPADPGSAMVPSQPQDLTQRFFHGGDGEQR